MKSREPTDSPTTPPPRAASGSIDLGGGVSIPAHAISFRTARSSGPGGQHVNKVETRVTALFDLVAADSLSEDQKDRIRRRLASRVTRAGIVRVVAQKHRSQAANRDEARDRLVRLLAEALRPRKRRKKTRPSGEAKRRRLEDKRRRGRLKSLRRRPDEG